MPLGRQTTPLAALILAVAAWQLQQSAAAEEPGWPEAQECALEARDALGRCHRYLIGWLAHADPQSGLIPRNLTDSPFWNARDSAADNYPFMVLTAALTDRPLFDGRMHDMLRSERQLTCRLGPLPDDFLFATQTFRTEKINHGAIIFGASEYVKDGLIPLTEWLGPSPWAERMLELLDGIIEHADQQTPVGVLPATDHEVCGELMQSLSRAYWMTERERYREMAFRIADYFFVYRLPTEEDRLRLDDHGCEVIAGLSEAYFLAAHTDPERRAIWRPKMQLILDRVLEVGRDEYGFFYDLVNPRTGEVLRNTLTDNWGYNYNAFLTVAELDDVDRYREAVRFVLSNLPQRKDYLWENGGADGYADSIEGGLNLLNRNRLDVGFDWVDYSAAIMLRKQRDDGIIEGWHGDGNYARTAILYALWKTKGTSIHPWRADVAFGAEQGPDGTLRVALRADWRWSGTLTFDIARHREYMHLPTDYPRLNQFPEWFTVEPQRKYAVTIDTSDGAREMTGKELREGLAIRVRRGQWLHVTIRPASQ